MKRFKMGKSSSLKAQTKEAEGLLDVTSIMLAREQVVAETVILSKVIYCIKCVCRCLDIIRSL